MEQEKTIYIERKDGIKYYRKPITKKIYDTNLNIRIDKETIEKLKQIASENGIKYQALVRNILEKYVEEV